MRYEKAETILRIALDMQGSALGLSIEEVTFSFGVDWGQGWDARDQIIDADCTRRFG